MKKGRQPQPRQVTFIQARRGDSRSNYQAEAGAGSGRLQVWAQSCPTLCNPMDYIAHQAPLSMYFSRQEYWSGLPFPSPGDLPDPGMEPSSLRLLHWQVDSLPLVPPGKPNETGSPKKYDLGKGQGQLQCLLPQFSACTLKVFTALLRNLCFIIRAVGNHWRIFVWGWMFV